MDNGGQVPDYSYTPGTLFGDDKKVKDFLSSIPENIQKADLTLQFIPRGDKSPEDATRQRFDDLLAKMHKEGRLTEREKDIMSNKYEILLQALVSYQQREVELIDHLNAKNTILEMLNSFVKKDADAKYDKEANLGKNEKPQEEMSVVAIRENLLAQKNKLEMQENMRAVLMLELKILEFEKSLLSLHYSRMVKPNELDKELRDLQRNVNELEMEVGQIKEETAQLQLDIGREEKACHEDESSLDKLELDTLTKQMSVQTNSNKPVHISKEADKIQNAYEQFQDDYDFLCTQYIEASEAYNLTQSKIDKLSGEVHSLMREDMKHSQTRKVVMHETEGLANQMETLINREQVLNDKIVIVSKKLTNTLKNRKELTDDLHSITYESNKAQREHKKLERAIRIASESHLNAKLAYDKMKSAFETSKPRDGGNWEKLIGLFSKEIGNLKVILNRKIDEATVKSSLVKKLQKKLSELYEDQLFYGKELQDLIRTTVRKRREREEKSEQCIKLESQIYRLVQDKKMQQLILTDCQRAEGEYSKFMREVKKSYNQTKIERSTLMNDVIKAKQKISEQEEKLKIVCNEIDSLNKRLSEGEMELHRAHYLRLNAVLARDTMKGAAFRGRDKFRSFKDKKGDLILENKTIRKQIEKLHQEASKIRLQFDKHVNKANSVALSVRERIEEYCTIIEKSKQEGRVLLEAKQAIFSKEEEQASLVAKKAEVQKHLFIAISVKPDQNKMLARIDTLRDELECATRERLDLEKKFHDFENPERIRELNFDLLEKKETVSKLEGRLDEIEKELALKECLSLEKDLILKQLDQITKEAMEQASNLKSKFHEYVRQIVELRKNLSQVNFKINGMICETSIAVASAESSENMYNELKCDLAEAEQRFEKGYPPTDEWESEMKRIGWRRDMMSRAKGNEGKRFLFPVYRPSGAQILMNRMKPKALCDNPNYNFSIEGARVN